MFQKLLIIFTFIWPAYYTKIALNYNGTEKFLITGGSTPKIQTYEKHTVSIADLGFFDMDDETAFGDGHFCAGTIIAVQVILTAAHCVYEYRKKPKMLVVIAGAPIRTRRVPTTQILHVKKIIIHPSYKYVGNTADDIAMLLLVERIVEDEYTAKRATVSRTKQATEWLLCEALGWGAYGENQLIFSEPLQHMHLTIYKEEYCERYAFPVPKTFCAGDLLKRVMGACRGDAGGPLFCNGYLSGITVYNQDCNQVKVTYFTDVSKYVDWIQSQYMGNYDFRDSGQSKIANNNFVKIASLIACLFVESFMKETIVK